ncbi:hypothetical protein OAI86_05070 [Alphaproteobacteria bacterium]|nr:hypothetical protein [Alphaproteobacteria bacterium]
MKINIATSGLGWWVKLMIDSFSSSNKFELLNLFDTYVDESAIKLANDKQLITL